MLQRVNEHKVETEGSALVRQGKEPVGDYFDGGKQKPWCEKCNKPWHTVETCWEIHGRPTHFIKSW